MNKPTRYPGMTVPQTCLFLVTLLRALIDSLVYSNALIKEVFVLVLKTYADAEPNAVIRECLVLEMERCAAMKQDLSRDILGDDDDDPEPVPPRPSLTIVK